MIKQVLRKVLGHASLNYEELNTILCECEQILNSRPITYVSEDAKDPSPLTPMMFLHELPSSGVPDIDEIDAKELSRRAKYRQQLRNDLRNRFRNEYLGQLRLYSVKNKRFDKVNVGDLVLLEEANKKRIHWPLAKIVEVLPGKDNVIRLAKVKTENSVFLRPVQRLYPLELQPVELVPKTIERKDPPDSTIPVSDQNDGAAIQKPDIPSGDRTSYPITFPVTRVGRAIRPPQRLNLLSSSIISDLKVGECYELQP
nr:uncharacterized protein LOC122272830 [Parasteatoda tepidariorum]